MTVIPEAHLLYDTAALYKSLSRRNYRVLLADGTEAVLRFPLWAYHHLVGLHKFRDIAEVTVSRERGRSAMSIFNDIMHGRITEYDLQPSDHYDDVVPERLRVFLQIEKLLNRNSKVVFPYERNALRFDSRLEADLLMFQLTFESDNSKYYMYLFFRKADKEDYYLPVSFFEADNDKYLYGQKCREIADIEMTEHTPKNRKVQKHGCR